MHPVIFLLLSSITTDWVWLLIFTRFLDHTQRRTTVGRTTLNEWSVRCRDLYLTTHNNHKRQTSMPPRRAEDFYLPLKIRRLRPGLNPRTWYQRPARYRSRLYQWCRSNKYQKYFMFVITTTSDLVAIPLLLLQYFQVPVIQPRQLTIRTTEQEMGMILTLRWSWPSFDPVEWR